MMVECKDRKTWSVEGLTSNRLKKEILEIVKEWFEETDDSLLCVIFRDTKFAWATGFLRSEVVRGKPVIHSVNVQSMFGDANPIPSHGSIVSFLPGLDKSEDGIALYWHMFQMY